MRAHLTTTPAPTSPRRHALNRRRAALGGAALVAATALAGPIGPTAAAPSPGSTAPHLDLGPADLPESRSTTTLQPGVTLTRITRGAQDPRLAWTLEVLVPATSTSPDPDAPPRALSDRESAEEQAERLRADGFDPRVEEVDQPAVADVPAGVLGYRVRVGRFDSRSAADAEKARLAAAGHRASSVYTGWDGDAADRGPWHVNVLTIDPRSFDGSIEGSFGPDLQQRETTSRLAELGGATAAVNSGFFVMDPAAGAPGDPAGAGVYDGRVLSEAVNGRPSLVLHDDARASAVTRLWSAASAVIDGRRVALDGVDRVPGLIRNCGGDSTDLVTPRPLHDVTCTDDAEVVAFTPEFASATPAGTGREVVLEDGAVVATYAERGTVLAPGQTSIQATGDRADLLAGLRPGDDLPVRLQLTDGNGPLATPPGTTVTNGGPLLVRDGHVEITQQQDGFVHPGDPSFAYGWFVKRNPRTFAGIDGQGRTVLVTVDGRTGEDLGLSIPEAAAVARSLGLVDAVNLDGGGSTTMVVGGRVISHPSDSTGERPVGDALLIGP